MKFVSLVLFVCAPFASGQTFSFGLKGGGFFTDPAERLDQSRRYVIGPSAEIGVASRVGIEVSALYSRFGAAVAGRSVRGNSVEFPVLGKYYFADRDAALRPWLSTGFAFRNIWFQDASNRAGASRRVNSTEPAVGAVAAGGVTFKTWIFRLTPEVRYTRWGGYNFPATNPNQLQALLGINF